MPFFLDLRTVEDACPYKHFEAVFLLFFFFIFSFSLLIDTAYIEPHHYGVVFVIQQLEASLL